MLKETEISWLTPYEEQILEAIIECGAVKAAAVELNLAIQPIYNALARNRVKLVKSRNIVNKINSYTKQSSILKRLLVPIQRVKPIELEEEAEEKWGTMSTQGLIETASQKPAEKKDATEEQEWKIEILASIKGKKKTSNAVFEPVELLTRYPYNYIDIKVAQKMNEEVSIKKGGL